MISPRFHWVLFVRSLVAVEEHPPAQVFRLLGRFLAQHGQEAIFLEERGNPLTVQALRRRGVAALRELATAWPELRYHTVEHRSGAHLVEWLGRTLATADLALVELGVDENLAYWVGQLTRPHFHTILVDLLPAVPELEPHRHRLDPSPFTAVICHPLNIPAYRGRTSARRLIVVDGPPEHLATAIAEAAIATLLQTAENLRLTPTAGQNGSDPPPVQRANGGTG